MWASNVNHTKKSESFFSTTLSITRAVPQMAVFWITIERILFRVSPTIRDNSKFRHVAIFRLTIILFNSAKGSHTRANLLGGMRNDQKIQNLSSQLKFFKRSFLPVFFACLSDYGMQLVLKRGLELDETTLDLIYINARCYLPIIFPLSLLIMNKNLRADYLANFVLCRKARNLHKESKVKVIATRESQESIIANLKMIGILSDVDTSQGGPSAAGLAMMGMGGSMPNMPKMSNGQRISISKDPTSITSVGSLAKNGSTGSSASMMMFTTRPKTSIPSVGSVG
ncbi:hypothetical protein CAEBREN_12545 [Caenorhabditis brenneri]|uniref:Uncharacterized protein n=1 Tax=Caenorhabditis brenneri TaxID=135651 RepID=G0NED2_CAEBE|nr:hypothetical protein CAEBREN_12545 [Caenorhabditis brenneri]